jgi:hypothetical protein
MWTILLYSKTSPLTVELTRMAEQFPALSTLVLSMFPVLGVSQEAGSPKVFQVTLVPDKIAVVLLATPVPSKYMPLSVPELLQQGRLVNWFRVMVRLVKEV